MRLCRSEAPSFITRERLAYVATVAVSAVFGFVGHHKIHGEVQHYNARLHVAQRQYDQASTAEQEDAIQVSRLIGDRFFEGEISRSEYQAATDYFQEPELPHYRQDGQLVGTVVPLALTVPEHISQSRRDKIFALGGTFSETELQAGALLAKQTGNVFDRAAFLKQNVRVDAHLDANTMAWADPQQLEKFKKLCAQIDRAQVESLPGYRAVLHWHAQQKRAAAKNVAKVKDHKSTWAVWTPY